jgi:hypothetical protein
VSHGGSARGVDESQARNKPGRRGQLDFLGSAGPRILILEMQKAGPEKRCGVPVAGGEEITKQMSALWCGCRPSLCEAGDAGVTLAAATPAWSPRSPASCTRPPPHPHFILCPFKLHVELITTCVMSKST